MERPAERHALKFPHLRQDFAASLVVFLVALPLCVGVAVASGVPAELGLVTGIVGGLVTGFMRGSSLQVTGPAAGLTVLVFEAVQEFGLPRPRASIVLATGVLQIAHGHPEAGALLPGHLGLRRRGHAGRHRPRADRRTALLDGGRQGARLRPGQDSRAARARSSTPSGTPAALASLARRRRHHRRPGAVEADAEAGAHGPRSAGRRRSGDRSPRWCSRCRSPPSRCRACWAPSSRRRWAPSASSRDVGRARHDRRLHPDRVRRVTVQRGGRGPAARRSAHRVRQGTGGAGRGQRAVRAARRAADDRGDRAQRGERPGGRADQGVPGAARRVAAAVRGAAAGRPRLHPDPGPRGHPGARRRQADPRPGDRVAVARAPRRGADPGRHGRCRSSRSACSRACSSVWRSRSSRPPGRPRTSSWRSSTRARAPSRRTCRATRPSCGCRRSSTAWRRCPRTGRSSWTCPACTTWTTPAVRRWRTGPSGTARSAPNRCGCTEPVRGHGGAVACSVPGPGSDRGPGPGIGHIVAGADIPDLSTRGSACSRSC